MINTIQQISNNRFRKLTNGNTSRYGSYLRQSKLFNPGEYNLSEYGRIVDTESLAGRAISRKVTVALKSGYEVVSDNDKFLERVKQRVREIEYVCGTSMDIIMRSLFWSLFTFNNAYLLITRSKGSSSSKGNKGKQPIAGISVLPVETIEAATDENGNTIGWRQSIGGEIKNYNKKEVIHIAVDQRPGMLLGTPPLEAVKDDIIALRKIEENVELLIDRSIFPLIHAKVGTDEKPAQVLEDGSSEVDIIARQLEDLDKTGGLATNERVELKAVGSESLALRVETYLNYFKNRVIIGLGVSSVDLGIGDSSGRTTGETLSNGLIDTVKFYHKIVEETFTDIFSELLYDDKMIQAVYAIEDEDIVSLRFSEPSQKEAIRIGSHMADLYAKGVITLTEARTRSRLSKDTDYDDYFQANTSKGLCETVSRLPRRLPPQEKKKKETLHNSQESIPSIDKQVIRSFEIPSSLISDEMKNYGLHKIGKRIDAMDYGLPVEAVEDVSLRVHTRLLEDITLSQLEVIKDEVIKYIFE